MRGVGVVSVEVEVELGSDWFCNTVPKLVPGVEVPVVAGVSVLRRDVGGV